MHLRTVQFRRKPFIVDFQRKLRKGCTVMPPYSLSGKLGGSPVHQKMISAGNYGC
jgi:hypothetical protein